MKRPIFLASALIVFAGLLGCSSDNPDAMFPTEDSGVADTGLDITRPSLDVPPLDQGTTDTRPSTDTGTRTDTLSPTDTGTRTDTGSPLDTGGGTGVCPSGCALASDCDPCWRPGETRIGQYCCLSGTCIYRGAGMTCEATPPPTDGGGPDGPDGFDFDVSEAGFDFDIPAFDGADFDAGTP